MRLIKLPFGKDLTRSGSCPNIEPMARSAFFSWWKADDFVRSSDDGRVEKFRALRVENEAHVVTAAILSEHRQISGD